MEFNSYHSLLYAFSPTLPNIRLKLNGIIFPKIIIENRLFGNIHQQNA